MTPRQKANRCLAVSLPAVGVAFGSALHRGATGREMVFGAVLYGAMFVGAFFILPHVAASAQAARARKAAAAQSAPARPIHH